MLWNRRKRWWWTAAGAGLLISTLAIWFFNRARIPEVPIGVEHAVIIRYSGPELALKPYRRGVAVNLRLERVRQKGNARVYDFRYIVNRSGLFDITSYLTSADGQALPNLPSFQVRGATRLSQTMERRIRETEDLGIAIPHAYYEAMAAAILLWIAGFFLLVFWRRRRPAPAPAAAPPTLAAMFDALLERLRAGTLDAAGKAQLEKVMFRSWREQLAPDEGEMLAVVRQVEASAPAGAVYRVLEEWLHNPAAAMPASEVATALARHRVQSPLKEGS